MTGFVAGSLVFAAVAALAAALLAQAAGSLSPAIAAVSLVLGVLSGAWAFRSCRERPELGGPRHALGYAAAAAFAAVTFRQFIGLVTKTDEAVVTLNPYNYGDLPLHWTYIRYLARGAPFWPEDPILTGARWQYPFGSDLVAALFSALGAPLEIVLPAMGIFGSALLLWTLWKWGGAFALAAFVCSGGFAWARLQAGALLRPDDPDLAWKNLLLALFVPQRGFLYALPAGLLLLFCARDRLLRDRPGLPAWVTGLVWGALPLFHVHTFVVVSAVFALWSAAKRKPLAFARELAWAFGPATYAVLQVTGGLSAAGIVWWKPGWMIGREGAVLFLAQNFGLWLPLALLLLFLPPRDCAPEARVLIASGLGLGFVLFFVMLAPWEWDNTKAMLWAFLLIVPAVGAWLRERGGMAAAVAATLLLLPALPSTIGGLRGYPGLVVFHPDELEEVCPVVRSFPISARVAASQTFNHPVALCGQPVVAGYGGHLWSHGQQPARVEQDLRRLMMGEPGWQDAARRIDASFIFWGRREEAAFQRSSRPWAVPDREIPAGGSGTLYLLPD